MQYKFIHCHITIYSQFHTHLSFAHLTSAFQDIEVYPLWFLGARDAHTQREVS